MMYNISTFKYIFQYQMTKFNKSKTAIILAPT